MQPRRLKKSQTLEERGSAEGAKRTRDIINVEPLMLCPDCKTEMLLFGSERESAVRDVFSFECVSCGRIEGRRVLVSLPYSPKELN